MNDTFHYGGRPVTAGQSQDLTADKWQLLNELTLGAAQFGLGHRVLGVLKALLTFLPGKDIPVDAPAIVFPSNQTLSMRLNGMPESTLRRHLAQLVKSGLIRRQDSPNRKRYARFASGQGIAFGFDLSPLAHAAARIAEAGEHARQQRKERAVLHAQLTALCHSLGPCEETETARRALRRKNNTEELAALLTILSEMAADDLSITDSQTERHIQKTEKKDSVTKDQPRLSAVQANCPTTASFYPDAFDHWDRAIEASQKLAPMMGIERHVLRDAERSLGTQTAAIAVMNLLERITTLKNPGGYLRRLAQLGAKGVLSTTNPLNLGKLSADNLKNTDVSRRYELSAA